jgi:spore coat polysaccharide biosynthesis protein SpsF
VSRYGRTLIILQARMNSRRLPGKVLSRIGGWSLLEYCVARCLAAGTGEVVVATTVRPEDEAIVAMGRRLGVTVERGPADDVLARFAGIVAARPGTEVVVRATADNPFVDIGGLARLLKALGDRADYGIEEGLPIGGAVEVMRAQSLLLADRLATTPYDREHVTPWIKRATATRQVRPQAPTACRGADLRLTVDTRTDLQAVRHLAAVLAASGWDPRLAPLPEIIAAARTGAVAGVA